MKRPPTLTWRSFEDRDEWLEQEWPKRRAVDSMPGCYTSFPAYRGWRISILMLDCWIWKIGDLTVSKTEQEVSI
tara:strand:+ start:411 stop:632 length:222 start_codon:yes stop_codon:yes gene_type:complete